MVSHHLVNKIFASHGISGSKVVQEVKYIHEVKTNSVQHVPDIQNERDLGFQSISLDWLKSREVIWILLLEIQSFICHVF